MFDPRRICAVLNEERVRYVVVGGFAAVLHGSPLPTADVDLVPDRSSDNLDGLAVALERLGARLRNEAGPIEAPLDAALLRAMPLMLNLVTDAGDLDLTFEPAGPRVGYEAWNEDASDIAIGEGLTIRLASLEAVIDSKRAADREKDRRALPYLESLLEQIARTSAHDDDAGDVAGPGLD